MRPIMLLPLLTLPLIFNSCLMNQYKFKVTENGAVEYMFTASGDSADLYDSSAALPGGIGWETEYGTEIDTIDGKPEITHYYRARRVFRSGSSIPACFGLDYIKYAQTNLHQPVSVKKQDLFFMVNYFFRMEFPSRRKTELYGDPDNYVPEECKALESSDSLDEAVREELEKKIDNAYKLWAEDLLVGRFMRSLKKSLEMHPELKFENSKIEAVEKALRNYIIDFTRQMNGIDSLEITGIWRIAADEGYKVIEEQLNFLGDTTFFIDMKSMGEMFAREWEVTDDLSDETFKVEISLPGKIRDSNADSVIVESKLEEESDKLLLWEFNGEDFANNDMILCAMSTIFYPSRIYLLAGGLIIVIALSFWKIHKRKKNA